MAADASAETITIEIPEGTVHGDLRIPPNPAGVVIFAHGTGSSRLSPRNRSVAAALERGGFATLLMDLLTDVEEQIDTTSAQYKYRFDIPRLAKRVGIATEWTFGHDEVGGLPIGYFGASTGAAAALIAASEPTSDVRAIVSRGGRPDLAGTALAQVKAPTMLIVGGADYGVLELNQRARDQMTCDVRLELVPGATHLFEEPGTLAQAAQLACDWFTMHLTS
jgi:putative phosphoribosyl transferase